MRLQLLLSVILQLKHSLLFGPFLGLWNKLSCGLPFTWTPQQQQQKDRFTSKQLGLRVVTAHFSRFLENMVSGDLIKN